MATIRELKEQYEGLDQVLPCKGEETIDPSCLLTFRDEFKALLADEIHNHAWPLFEDGTIRPVMDETFPLDRAADAHRRMEAGDHIGKIVLKVADD